ncbi:hypothetical protein G3O08_11660 [Cryomorpha ignava]|uniref:Uncharacterized protein n=1 Tax=Cryomorpha ignava TaxID=101383 RepID=A0A7K3WRJ8_9FLAO|nr:hypothetical protein [Cryomorpha ignava]NEN24158.1 hypothetical protein [Cryomorpha ignava]
MKFINRYSKVDSHNYYHTEQFKEDNGELILAIGTSGNLGLITRLKPNGDLEWEKAYRISTTSSQLVFHKIIQLTPMNPSNTPGFQYIIHGVSGVDHYILSINAVDGSLYWVKKVQWPNQIVTLNLAAAIDRFEFYIAISDTTKNPFIGVFNGSCILSIGKTIAVNKTGTIINAIEPRLNGVVLAGKYNNTNQAGFIIDLDHTLVIAKSFAITIPANTIHDLEYDGKDYLVSGYIPSIKKVYVARFNGVSSPNAICFPKTGNNKSRIVLLPRGVYLLHYTTTHGILNLLDPGFVPQWQKELRFSGDENGISKIHFDLVTESITTDAYHSTVESVIVKTDETFESCKTISLGIPAITVQKIEVKLMPLSSVNASFNSSVPTVQINTLTPTLKYVCPPTVSIPTGESTVFQSPNFYIQSAGSTGSDSTKSIHSRWLFRGVLGNKHLPKRTYATNEYNFNKENDYVKIYRTKYRNLGFEIDLLQPPEVVDSTYKFWIYRFGQRDIYVYFRDTIKYLFAAAAHNPLTNPTAFFQAYGNNLIEIENKDDLFFAVQLYTNTNPSSGKNVKTETLTVSELAASAPKFLSNRKKFIHTQFSNMRLIAENGRMLRFTPFNCQIAKIRFEYYSDFIDGVNVEEDWVEIGDFGLNLNDAEVLSALEPSPGSVNGKWQRFNDNAFVKTANYADRWNGSVEPGGRNIRQMVEQYISLSDVVGNPTANESFPLDQNPPASMEISNLNLLNFAALDFHIARMLGLGMLDTDTSVFFNQYVYVATYVSSGDLEDGLGIRDVQHLAMSLPTGLNDHRLPKPVEISEIIPGAFIGNTGEPSNITDADGYTFDGIFRYVSIFNVPEAANLISPPFYATNNEFEAHLYTLSVYAGLEYRKNNDPSWQKPELSNTSDYQNEVLTGDGHNETRPLVLPATGLPLYVHKQNISGTHYYQTYGINWFSRAASSNVVEEIETNLSPANSLVAPSNVNAHLIRHEVPPMFTSQDEQDRYSAIGDTDKTLVRLTFDYHSHHELITRKIPPDSILSDNDILLPANADDADILFPDNEEIFAEEIEIFFRKQMPNNISGKATTIDDHPSNTLLSVIGTAPYHLASQDPNPPTEEEIIYPTVQAGTEANYVGGTFVIDNQEYVIYSIVGTSNPQITVYKKEISDSVFGTITPTADADNLQSPEITNDGFFMAIENMQNESSWSLPNPLSQNVTVGANWPIHREIIYFENDEGDIERRVEKTRGIWSSDANPATVETEDELEAELDVYGNVQYVDENGNPTDEGGEILMQTVFKGLYKITFQGIHLDQHSQYDTGGNPIEWYQGIVRIFTQNTFQAGNPYKTRKVLKVIKIKNIGEPVDLVVYARDTAYSAEPGYDSILTGANISVNFYPGYRAYLYKNTSDALNEANTLPGDEEDVRYTIFGLRSYDSGENYYSKIGTPAIMYAQKLIEAETPEQPEGPLYATRPDFFGRASYSFTTQFTHSPYAILMYRGNDEAFLNALYEKSTVREIRDALKVLGGNNEDYFTNRWTNFVNFTELASDGDFKVYPPVNVSPDGYKFPNPDKQALFDWANKILTDLELDVITDPPGSLSITDPKIFGFAKGAIYHAMNPLTQVPVIFYRIKSGNYRPKNKKQVIMDSNGHALWPSSPSFDMAPMMKRLNSKKTEYTDFTLDGTSDNIYFYGVRELSSQMKMGDFSPLVGPIKLVNSYPAEQPEIKRIMPILENQALGISPAVQLEVNAYPEVQNIRKITVFRSLNRLDAQSVRTMEIAKEYVIPESELTNPVWVVKDVFDDLEEVPFGEGLYYRIAVNRKVEYRDANNILINDFAPSLPSKIAASVIVETSKPSAPVLRYGSKPIEPKRGILAAIKFFWDKTCYNGTYHIYKMNSQGNWTKIYSVQSNDQTIYVDLLDTSLQTGYIETQTDSGDSIFHHFKVVAENTAGLLSTEENILTIYKAEEWIDVDTLP